MPGDSPVDQRFVPIPIRKNSDIVVHDMDHGDIIIVDYSVVVVDPRPCSPTANKASYKPESISVRYMCGLVLHENCSVVSFQKQLDVMQRGQVT